MFYGFSFVEIVVFCQAWLLKESFGSSAMAALAYCPSANQSCHG